MEQTKELIIPPDNTELMRSALVDAVKPELPAILAAQIELAKGLYIKDFIKDKKTGEVKTDDHGRPMTTRIYLKAPSEAAGQYLLNQVVGKPKETTLVEGRVNFILDL